MKEITVKIEGMMCGMCEAHVSDIIRKSFDVKKVTASHTKKEAVIITESHIPEQNLIAAIESMGYRVLGVIEKPYEKKGFLSSIFHKNK